MQLHSQKERECVQKTGWEGSTKGKESVGLFKKGSLGHWLAPSCPLFSFPTDLLTSDINDDLVCAMRIVQRPRGLASW